MTLETKINRLREAVDEHQKLDTTLTSYENREFEMWVEDLIELAEEKEKKGLNVNKMGMNE